jgi:cytochrome c oxidase subunit 3/cytochrome o ubiquinol oxidase subunit 3
MAVNTLAGASTLTGGDRYVGDEAEYRGKVGLVCFFIGELHMFGCLIATYIIYLSESKHSSTPPQEVLQLSLAIPATVCLLASSPISALGLRSLRRDRIWRFYFWWLFSMALGIWFLVATGLEWNDLITNHHLSMRLNFFGTTYFPLVGLHAAHVVIGLLAMLVALVLVIGGAITARRMAGAELVGWFWHFVDGVWLIIFSVVYLLPRNW